MHLASVKVLFTKMIFTILSNCGMCEIYNLYKEGEIAMSSISKEVKYSNKHDWWRAIGAAAVALIVGFLGGTHIDMNDYLNEAEKEKKTLETQIEKLEEENKQLITDKQNLEKELDDSLATSFPEGYYFPATGVYLLDNFEMKNEAHCRSFADSAASMKGQMYNNGLILSQDGQAVFYLSKKYKMLEFVVGPIDNNTTSDIATVKVYVDGQQMNKVINQKYETECTKYTFDISNCNELKIQWSNCGWSSYGIGDLKIYE